MMLTSSPIKAEAGAKLGLVDQIVDGRDALLPVGSPGFAVIVMLLTALVYLKTAAARLRGVGRGPRPPVAILTLFLWPAPPRPCRREQAHRPSLPPSCIPPLPCPKPMPADHPKPSPPTPARKTRPQRLWRWTLPRAAGRACSASRAPTRSSPLQRASPLLSLRARRWAAALP
jgi:hypothetical protein